MDKTLDRIAYSVIRQVKPRLSDDVELSDQWVKDQAVIIRSTLIKEAYGSKINMDHFYQKIDYAVVEKDDTYNINNLTFPLDAVKWYIQIPRTMSGIMWGDIKFVGDFDFDREYGRLTFTAFRMIKYDEYTSNDAYYTYSDESGRLDLRNPKDGVENITVLAIFEDPREITGFVDDTTIFPIPQTLLFKLEALLEKKILSTYGVPVDVLSDRLDNTQNVVVPSTQEQQQQQ